MKITKPPAPGISRRLIMLGGLAAPLGACEPFGADYGAITKALSVSLGFEKMPGITLEQASAVPYATIAVRIGGGGETMLVLASSNDQNYLWTSSERIAITTRAGRIISTAGLQWNLSNSQFLQSDPIAAGLRTNLPSQPVYRLLDLKDVQRFSVRIAGQFELLGPETIEILGTKIDTIVVAENCKCQEFDWEFKNRFWMDRETGAVWASQQSVHPNLPPISISVLRPAG